VAKLLGKQIKKRKRRVKKRVGKQGMN